MGQGFYTAIFYGGIFDPLKVTGLDYTTSEGDDCFDEWHTMVKDAAESPIVARLRYEADESWFGFLIADCGQGISWEEDKSIDIARNVFDLDTLSEIIRTSEKFKEIMELATKSFERLKEAADKKGWDIGAGRLMLVNDYD